MVLTKKQREDLHKAITEYLRLGGFSESSEVFARELSGLADGALPASGGAGTAGPTHGCALEKKWTSVVRLQRKTMELESRCQGLEDDLSKYARGGRRGGGDGGGAGDDDDGVLLPRGPARHRLAGHRAPVTHVAVHPVFPLVVSCSEDGTCKVWDYETGEYERTLKGHTDSVQCCAFSPSGALLATCSADLSVKLWSFGGEDGSDYACQRTLQGHEHNVSSVAFDPAGDSVLSASRDGTVRVWEAATGFCTATLRDGSGASSWVRCVDVDASGTLVATAHDDHTARVWSLPSGNRVSRLQGHSHVVEACAFSRGPLADARTAAALAEAGSDAAEAARAEIARVAGSGAAGGPGAGGAAGVGAAGAGAAGADAGALGAAGAVPPANFVVTCSRDKTVRVFLAATGAQVAQLAGHDNWVRAARFLPAGTHVVTVADDRSMRVWELRTGRCCRKIADAHGHFVSTVAIAAQGGILVTGSVDNSLAVWEAK